MSITPDWVHQPSHYKHFSKEVKDIIRFVLGEEGYKAYCQGCELKYRLRAGFKDRNLIDAGKVDLEKALKYNSFRREVEDNATPSDKD
jgi:hypothetical protein